MKEKLTKCSACGAEIAKNAKACPQCGAKIKKKHIVRWIVLALVVLIIIIAASGSDEPTKVGEETPGENNSGNHQTQNVFAVGDKVKLNDVVVTLNSVTESQGKEFFRPTDGNVYVVCEFTIENNSKEEITVSSLMSFTAYVDDYAVNLSLSAMVMDEGKNQLDGSVAAGKKMNGVIGYEIPADWEKLELRFTPDFWSSKEIVFVTEHK